MRQISRLKGIVDTWRNLDKKVTDLATLVDLSLAEEDRSLEEEIPREIEGIERSLEALEFQLHLGGKYDPARFDLKAVKFDNPQKRYRNAFEKKR